METRMKAPAEGNEELIKEITQLTKSNRDLTVAIVELNKNIQMLNQFNTRNATNQTHIEDAEFQSESKERQNRHALFLYGNK